MTADELIQTLAFRLFTECDTLQHRNREVQRIAANWRDTKCLNRLGYWLTSLDHPERLEADAHQRNP